MKLLKYKIMRINKMNKFKINNKLNKIKTIFLLKRYQTNKFKNKLFKLSDNNKLKILIKTQKFQAFQNSKTIQARFSKNQDRLQEKIKKIQQLKIKKIKGDRWILTINKTYKPKKMKMIK